MTNSNVFFLFFLNMEIQDFYPIKQNMNFYGNKLVRKTTQASEIAIITSRFMASCPVRINTKALCSCVPAWIYVEEMIRGARSHSRPIKGRLKAKQIPMMCPDHWGESMKSSRALWDSGSWSLVVSAQHRCTDSRDGFGSTRGAWFCFQIKHEPRPEYPSTDIYLRGDLRSESLR